MKKKVLLMGASGSGKTSMRSLIFSNNPASVTTRLGATIDVEQNHVRFLGDLILNLWDCGGQDAFMDSYLTTQRSTIFQHVGVMIYVFDADNTARAARRGGEERENTYFRDTLDGLRQYSPDASIFLLIHKMDLIKKEKAIWYEKRKMGLLEMMEASKGQLTGDIQVYGTSIYDETLYKAWSSIVHTLIPNVEVLSRHLKLFADACSATEVILFERTTFLVIATSHSSTSLSSSPPSTPTPGTLVAGESANGIQGLPTTRYERTSELIKGFKHGCSRVREEFQSLEMELPGFTAVLDEMTANTYVLIIVHKSIIETAAIKLNIRMARSKFEELQKGSNLTSG